MGILDKIKKIFKSADEEESEYYETLSPEELKKKLTELVNLSFYYTENPKSVEIHLNQLSKKELKFYLKEMDRKISAAGFPFQDVNPSLGSTTTWGREFPGFKKLIKDILKKKEESEKEGPFIFKKRENEEEITEEEEEQFEEEEKELIRETHEKLLEEERQFRKEEEEELEKAQKELIKEEEQFKEEEERELEKAQKKIAKE